ncbi:MAG: hypothetical protein J7647_13700 [Cyanobacteria bacterium SBLK]|nr:hypothetical protein [Cyanobacteria bacterium SBLK]
MTYTDAAIALLEDRQSHLSVFDGSIESDRKTQCLRSHSVNILLVMELKLAIALPCRCKRVEIVS